MEPRNEFLTIVLLSLVFFGAVVWWALSGAPGCIPDGILVPLCTRPSIPILLALGVILLALGVYLWFKGGEKGGEEEEGG